MSNAKLRYYQRETVDAVECAWFEYPRVVVKSPTGSGKTVIASVIAENSLPERTLVLADQNELLAQPLRTLKRVSGIYAALEQAGQQASLSAQVVIGSSQTLCRKNRRERFPRDHFQRIIVDECHRSTQRDIEICDYFEPAMVCGMTATPFRANLADLSKWYGAVAYKMEPINFIQEGFAPEEIIRALPVEISLEKVGRQMTTEGSDYKAEDVDSTIEPYFDAICELVKEHAEGRFGIAYLPLIRSSKAFAACLRRHGITARHVDGEMDDRDLLIESFSRKEFSWLVNAGVVSTGVDIPIADCFLCLRPTRSPSWYQQARGRVWRVLPGVIDHLTEKNEAAERRAEILKSEKPNSLVFDLLWQNDELGVMRPGDMYAESEYDAKQIFEKTKKPDAQNALEIALRVQADREAAVVKALEQAAIKSGANRIDASHVGALIGDPKLASYQPLSRWEMDPLTEPQKNALSGFGVDPDSISCKGQAKALMDAIGFRMRMGLCTLKQLRILKEHNSKLPAPLHIKNVEGLSLDEATKHIDKIFRARRGQYQ